MAEIIPTGPSNPILDPDYARSEVRRIFGDQLDVAREVVHYGARLLPRAYGDSARDIPDTVLVAMLFRQVVAMMDASVLSLENGAVYSSFVSTRAVLEASLSIDWILKNGKERWGYQYYVHFIRQRRASARIWIPRTPEHRRFRTLTAEFPGESSSHLSPERIAEARKQLKDANRLLRRRKFREINSRFAESAVRRGRNIRDVEWFRPGGPASIADMAARLGRAAEYQFIYRFLSGAVHAGPSSSHTSVSGRRLVVEPIRDLRHFHMAFSQLITIGLMKTFELIIREYRNEELRDFKKEYFEKWRARIHGLPDVRYETDHTDL